MNAMHEVDYKIFGEDLQYVEVELDPQEAVVAEAGAMMYMEDAVEMETIFGDGSAQSQSGGLMGAHDEGPVDGARAGPSSRSGCCSWRRSCPYPASRAGSQRCPH